MKVLFAGGGTGGHLVPALTIADELVRHDESMEPVFVGAVRGIEATILPDRTPAYPYHLVSAAPIYRREWWKNVSWIWTGPRLWSQSRRILRLEEPKLIVATGGYAAAAIAYVGARAGVPLVLQEQNAQPGLTTRRLAGWAREIYLGYPEAAHRLKPGAQTVVTVTGNPIGVPRDDRVAARNVLGLAADMNVCLVMGGSQGARAINERIATAIERGFLDDVVILWATGYAHHEALSRFEYPPFRQLRPYWSPISTAYAATDLIVGRSGAMSTAEYAAWGKPSVLIPLPTAAANHQAENARAMADAGASVFLPENQATAASLGRTIKALLHDRDRLSAMGQAALARAKPGATRQIVNRILELLD